MRDDGLLLRHDGWNPDFSSAVSPGNRRPPYRNKAGVVSALFLLVSALVAFQAVGSLAAEVRPGATPTPARELSQVALQGDHPLASGYRPFFGHAGVDFAVTGDGKTAVYSPVSGTVIANTEDCGKVAVYDGRNTIILAHLKERTRIGSRKEEAIQAGDYLGLAADVGGKGAGCAAEGAHLHLEIRSGRNAAMADPGQDNRATTLDPLSYGYAKRAPGNRSELSVEERLALDREEARRLKLLEENPGLRFKGTAVLSSACGNGDFESGIDPTQWAGGNGIVDSSGDPNFANFVAGLFPGPLNDPNSHQTSVGIGLDTNVSISQVAPGGSTHAVRVGNSASGAGSELLSKTFTVTAAESVIKFWYAVVFQDPQSPPHTPSQHPSFWVRVLDSTGAVIPGAVNLGNNSDKLISSESNPFFVRKQGTETLHQDWSCAEINLSHQIGKTVTVEFVTEDCTLGAHFGYAYVDNFCGKCSNLPDPTGTITFNQAATSTCGRGQVCFDYTLPHAGAFVGTALIKLDLLQNGTVVSSMSKPATSGTGVCFDLDPATLPGLSAGLGGFDVVGTAQFTINGTSLATKTAGAAPNGQRGAMNDDYKIACEPVGCCPGPNLIQNGNFELGNSGFTSSYLYVPNPNSPGSVPPGRYSVLDSTHASTVSGTWNVQSYATCNATGKFLAANGATGQPGSKKLWAETVGVVPGKEYRFCANFRNMPQCSFDVKPKVELRFSSPPNTTAPAVISANPGNACDWVQASRSIQIPGGISALTSEIWLDETGLGDGNDVALDGISLQEMTLANASYVLLNLASSNLTPTTYNITATPAGGQPYSYYWEVCEINGSGNCIPATQVANPSPWWVPGANNFKGYVGTSALVTTNPAPGVFETQKKYQIKYGVFGQCTSWTESRWYFGFSHSAKKLVVRTSARDLALAVD